MADYDNTPPPMVFNQVDQPLARRRVSNAAFESSGPAGPPFPLVPEAAVRNVALEGRSTAAMSGVGSPIVAVRSSTPIAEVAHPPIVKTTVLQAEGATYKIGGAENVRLVKKSVRAKSAVARARKAVVIRDKKQLQYQTGVLIAALERAIDYRPRPGSNEAAPELYRDLSLERPENLQEVKDLLLELRRSNDLLERAITKSTQKSVIEVRKHLNTFLGKFAGTVGVGAGSLLIAVAATYLYNTGYLDPSLIGKGLRGK